MMGSSQCEDNTSWLAEPASTCQREAGRSIPIGWAGLHLSAGGGTVPPDWLSWPPPVSASVRTHPLHPSVSSLLVSFSPQISASFDLILHSLFPGPLHGLTVTWKQVMPEALLKLLLFDTELQFSVEFFWIVDILSAFKISTPSLLGSPCCLI